MSQTPDNPAPATTEVAHKPFIPDEQVIPEFSLLPLVVGAILGIVFGASSLYLVLKVGMTISASIPVAVISITLFKALSSVFGIRRATILENNIVQTTGSAGESIAFGVGVTMPALMILGYEMEVMRVMTVACLGGLLGVLMMIPLRRGLIVKQHGKLTYPEGTACAEVLMVGEQGGTNASTVFTGFGIGFVYKFLMGALKLWKDIPTKILGWYKGVEVGGEFAPELLGVGYIIGPSTGCIMMGGGILSTLVIIPLIKLFGESQTTPIYPATELISAMDTHSIWANYVLYIGAGAVATGGIISLFSSLPLIFTSFKAGLADFGAKAGDGTVRRTERDLPLSFVVIGTLLLVGAIWASPYLNVNLVGAVLIILFGFLFVTVSSRLTGEIGSSSNPISGMTVSTLLLTCLIFLGMGWTGASYRLTALSIAAVVCIAASNGGTTSQDLKTGFLVGGTPRYQQIAILVGAFTSAIVIGYTLLVLNDASTVYAIPSTPFKYKADVTQLTRKETIKGPEFKHDQKEYRVLLLNEPTEDLLPGKYLVNEDGTIAYVVDPGINGVINHRDADRTYVPFTESPLQVDVAGLKSRERPYGPQAPQDQTEYFVYTHEQSASSTLKPGKYLVDEAGAIKYFVDPGPKITKYDSPKAKLMSMIIDGILTQKLPWILVIIGACIALVLELCQVSSLPFAVGVYLPFSASVPIFIGGIVRWLADLSSKQSATESESSPGVLMSSGLIAGGAIAGICIALLSVKEELMAKLDLSRQVGDLATSDLYPTLIFFGLCLFLFAVGRQWLFGAGVAIKKAETETKA